MNERGASYTGTWSRWRSRKPPYVYRAEILGKRVVNSASVACSADVEPRRQGEGQLEQRNIDPRWGYLQECGRGKCSLLMLKGLRND